jgi:IclR family transcriptional regulator, KDG regulon repressor
VVSDASTPGATSGRDHSSLSSVANAARLLREFGRGDTLLGVTELSRRLGLSKSTVHRLASTLTKERLLEQDPATGAYRLAVTMFDLGVRVAIRQELHQLVLPVLERLRSATSESAEIGVLDGREVVFIERRASPHAVRTFVRLGHRGWAHSTASGKVLLAALPADELERRLAGWTLVAATERTITDPDLLRRELAAVRGRGWATNVDEAEMGLTSVAAPIRNARGEAIAALSLDGPTMRVAQPSMRRYSQLVVEAAAGLSLRLGHRGGVKGA